MGCEFLIGRQIKVCDAFHSQLVLSVEELETRCMTRLYQNCVIYKKCKKQGVKLPLKEYLKEPLLPIV